VLTTPGKLDLAQGDVLTVTVSGIVLVSVSPATTISNQATVTYTSLDGPQVGERDGSDGETGDLNNYARSALAPDIVTVGILEIEKSADWTTATIGEVVTYTVNITVGEGTTNNVVLSDTLPTRCPVCGGEQPRSSVIPPGC
jgi:large repetitive protein